ncbi:MAG TPA: helix-turn-helix domain-containing protein [Caulobacterales bacterium]|nr:helix-turn-helix domain-containing protein [Caulobacterales bacterium]
MADGGEDRREARRLRSEQRRAEILAAAGRALDDQGFLPLPIEQIAREAGASTALIYAYFPKQVTLYNALLAHALEALAGKIARLKPGKFEEEALAAALLYFEDVADHGPLLHLLMTDAHLGGARDGDAMALRNSLWLRFLRASRAYVDLPPEERVAALAILLSIPEEVGRLAHGGEIARERARVLCGKLMLSALRGLRDEGRPRR